MAFKIWNDGNSGRNCHIEIDGEDVSHNFMSLSITADVNSVVTIEMDPMVAEQKRFDRPARLIFGAKDTRDLLIEHGWTPPED